MTPARQSSVMMHSYTSDLFWNKNYDSTLIRELAQNGLCAMPAKGKCVDNRVTGREAMDFEDRQQDYPLGEGCEHEHKVQYTGKLSDRMAKCNSGTEAWQQVCHFEWRFDKFRRDFPISTPALDYLRTQLTIESNSLYSKI